MSKKKEALSGLILIIMPIILVVITDSLGIIHNITQNSILRILVMLLVIAFLFIGTLFISHAYYRHKKEREDSIQKHFNQKN